MPEDTLSHGTTHMIDDFSSAGQCPLNSSTLWAKSADDKLLTFFFFFFFFNFPWKEKMVWQFIQTGDDLYEMSNLYLFIFLGKNATCISKCRLLKVLPTMLRVNSSIKYARGRWLDMKKSDDRQWLLRASFERFNIDRMARCRYTKYTLNIY